MSAEGVALIAPCEERSNVWLPDDGGHWKAYLTHDQPLGRGIYSTVCLAGVQVAVNSAPPRLEKS